MKQMLPGLREVYTAQLQDVQSAQAALVSIRSISGNLDMKQIAIDALEESLKQAVDAAEATEARIKEIEAMPDEPIKWRGRIDKRLYYSLKEADVIGPRLRLIREWVESHLGKRIGLQTIADGLGVSNQHISAVELNLATSQNPRFRVVYQWAKLFGVSSDVLMDDFYQGTPQLFYINYDESRLDEYKTEREREPVAIAN